MSCVVVVSPLVIAGWPIITAAVTGAIASMGFNIVQSAATTTNPHIDLSQRASQTTRVDIEVEESEVLESSMPDERIVVEKEGMRAIFTRDERGALKLCMEGEGHSKSELKRVGQDLINRVTQQYVYHR